MARSLLKRAEKLIGELLELGLPGIGRLEGLLFIVAPVELWSLVSVSLWRAYHSIWGTEGAPARRVSLLARVCETGGNKRVRLYALRAMPLALADSPFLWEIALSVLASCSRDADQEIAEAATIALTPILSAEAAWVREVILTAVDMSTDREVLLLAIPLTKRFLHSPEAARAVEVLFSCYGNVLEKEVREAVEEALTAYQREHPTEYRNAENEYARRARTWVDQLMGKRIGGHE